MTDESIKKRDGLLFGTNSRLEKHMLIVGFERRVNERNLR